MGLRTALALGAVLGCCVLALGQSQNTGTISGNVLDAHGNVVVGAAITIVDAVTGATRTEHSNGKGEYLFNEVTVGTYTLTVSAPTFETYVVDGIQLDATANVRTDAKLTAGSVNKEITVESEGTTVDTRSATLATLIDNNLVENLPIDGNNVVSLAALLPGVTNVNAPTTFTSDTGGPTFNISGSRNNQNLFLLDGQLWNNLFYNTGLNYPPHEALQEITVMLNNYKAQYGRNVGSIMNVLTKSGSNTVHGAVWEYMQNKAFNAADYISQVNPPLVQNQFGATIGGPIKHDKIFYFLAVQDLRVAQTVFARSETLSPQERGWDVAPTATSAGVPHMCQYPGFAGMQCANFGIDFPTTIPVTTNSSGVTGPTCAGVTDYRQCYLRNPLENQTYNSPFQTQVGDGWTQSGGTGQSPCLSALTALNNGLALPYSKNYLPYEELPSICFNPVAVAFMNAYIPYTTPGLYSASGFPQTNTTAKQPRNDWDGLARIDINLGRHTIDARIYITNANDVTSNSATNGGSAPGVASYEQDANSGGIYYGNIGDTLVVSANTVNVFRVGYKRYNYLIYPTDPTTLQALGSNIMQPAYVPSLPQVEVENRFKVGSANSTWSWTVNEDEEMEDNLTWTHGNHSFQFGAQYLHLQYLHRSEGTPNVESGLSFSQADASDFLMGLLASVQVQNYSNLGALQNDLYMYAQDDWRATAKLTLNYGLRYEMPFAWHSADGQGVTWSPGFQSGVIPSAPSGLGYEGDRSPGNANVRSRYNNLAPRFGFAYDVFGTGKTVVRGGFGIFYDAINASVVGIGAPYHYNATYSFANTGGLSQPLAGDSPIAPNYTPGSTYFGTPYSVAYADPNITTPYTEAINFGFQQHIGSAGTLEANYVGKFGRHQIIQFDQNPGIYDCTGSYYQSNPNIMTGYCPGGVGAPSGTSTDASEYEQDRVKYPGYAYGGQGIVDSASVGNSNYNSLQVQYTQRARKSLSIKASYTYSKSLDIQSNGQTNTANVPMTPADVPTPFSLHSQYSVSDFDATHIFALGWVWNLPLTTHFDRPVRAVINNWIFSGIYSARTGQPVNITLAGDDSLTGDRPQRPMATPGVNPNLPSGRHRADKVAHWFNNTIYIEPTSPTAPQLAAGALAANAAFYTPILGTWGNVGRNSMRGPGFIATNFTIERIFPLLRKGTSLEFKAEAYNVFNTPNLANPNAVLSNSVSNTTVNSFGVVQGTVGTNGNVGTNGRRMQIGLILHY